MSELCSTCFLFISPFFPPSCSETVVIARQTLDSWHAYKPNLPALVPPRFVLLTPVSDVSFLRARPGFTILPLWARIEKNTNSHQIIHFPTSKGVSEVSERASERSGGREQSEQSGASERVSGASERANGRERVAQYFSSN